MSFAGEGGGGEPLGLRGSALRFRVRSLGIGVAGPWFEVWVQAL